MVRTPTGDKLGTMSARRAFWKWSAIGLVIAVFLLWTQAITVDGLAGLLQVGEASNLRPLIEDQLGAVPLADGFGHDGQIFYAIGADLSGDEVGPLLDHAAYRYRRILYPLVSSLFGLLDGWALLYGMMVVAAASMAVSAGIVGVLAARAGKPDLLALAVILNPGVWVSVRLLTSDAPTLALMLGALYAFTGRRNNESASTFALSVLAKDVNVATPVPLGLQFRNWKMLIVPVGVLAAWMGYLTIRFGGGFSSRGNLDWPLVGILDATANWSGFDATEWVYVVFAILSMVTGAVFSFRKSWLQWPIIAWTGLAVVSSSWVWDFGNNAARAFAPIVVLIALTGVYASSGRGVPVSGSNSKKAR